MRTKAFRRKQREKKIAKRSKQFIGRNVEQKGRLDKNHYACGCPLCKPYKHNAYGESRFKPSELRKLYDIGSVLIDEMKEKELDIDEMLNKEATEAMDCHLFGPCERCLARSKDETN